MENIIKSLLKIPKMIFWDTLFVYCICLCVWEFGEHLPIPLKLFSRLFMRGLTLSSVRYNIISSSSSSNV